MTDINCKDRKHLVTLLEMFHCLAKKNDFISAYPEFPSLSSGFLDILGISDILDISDIYRFRDKIDFDVLEEQLTRIYCYIHEKDVRYSDSELKELKKMEGYWCYAGGLTPLLRAESYITGETRVADYGAGNGLQGLLLQYLYRHRKTVQIELSGYMIEKGQRLQKMMGIPDSRVEWIRKNIMEVSPVDFDFIYIYRPVRPDGEGRVFYESFAKQLETADHPVTVFSIADCLKDFMGNSFRIFYDDGHLRCFSNT